jgi:hypothetical protein
MNEDIYEKLRQWMDHISPYGYPKTSEGDDIWMLKYFFTPEEAAAAGHLNASYQSVEVLATLIGKSVEEAVALFIQWLIKV